MTALLPPSRPAPCSVASSAPPPYSIMTDTSTSFWKKKIKSVPGSIKPVYGAQHPPRQDKPNSEPLTPNKKKGAAAGGSGGGRDAFEEFRERTDDAWDDGEDELMISSQFKMSRRDVQVTALKVIQNHSASQQQQASAMPSGGRQDSNGSGGMAGAKESISAPGGGGTVAAVRAGQHRRSTSGGGNSVPGTPTSSHTPSGPRQGGPGLGMRLRSPQQWDEPSLYAPAGSGGSGGGVPAADERIRVKLEKFEAVVRTANVDMDELRKLSWSGIPAAYRATAWKLLSGYLPTILDRRSAMLERKRLEYHNFVEQYYETRNQEFHKETYRQIHIDIPRMSPLIPLFQQELVQLMFERVLYIWAIRHPASGYVQGINDLVTPFFVVFLTEYVQHDETSYDDVENYDLGRISPADLQSLEADCFWCYSKLLDGIQDNYTFAQPGIQTRVNSLKELISRIDNALHKHLELHRVEYLQFSFRWMNNLLMREVPLRCVVRLWDTYLSESDGFASFHLYVCAAFLTRFSADLRAERDFHGLMLLLQNLPTQNWTNEEIGLILAEAYRLKYMFADAPNHFKD